MPFQDLLSRHIPADILSVTITATLSPVHTPYALRSVICTLAWSDHSQARLPLYLKEAPWGVPPHSALMLQLHGAHGESQSRGIDHLVDRAE
jgi:hypothetical protein